MSSDETLWLTYRQAADKLGVSPQACGRRRFVAAGHVRRETTDRPAYRSPNTVPCPDTVRPGARRFFRGQPSGPCWTLKGDVEKLEALLAAERERADKAIAAFEALARRLEAMAEARRPGVVALAALRRLRAG